MRRAAEAEAIEIPPEAVAALARSATGSFRDALGTLEQLLTYSGSEIALEDVLAVLGVADAALLEETIDAVAAGRRARGAAGARGVRRAAAATPARSRPTWRCRARELLVVQTLGEVPAELALTPEADARLQAQAAARAARDRRPPAGAARRSAGGRARGRRRRARGWSWRW